MHRQPVSVTTREDKALIVLIVLVVILIVLTIVIVHVLDPDAQRRAEKHDGPLHGLLTDDGHYLHI